MISNLPLPTSSFVGRTTEIAESTALLSGTRLLTLTGSGGVGKTRLALQVARRVLPEFEAGIWLVELAAIDEPDHVLQVVASTLGLSESPYLPLLNILKDYLRPCQILLILDNCEHLIRTCAELADHLLCTCPTLTILTTSREALGINGEVTYRVPSLSLPDVSGYETSSPCEAVQLFTDHARAAQPHLIFDDENALAIARICERLDGIPLALELAAACVTVFTPDQITQRLNDRFRLLTRGSRTALPRQQTLRATIDWSYALLSEAERTLLQQLSIFAGSWSFEAAEVVAPDLDMLELLPRLVDKSLVLPDNRADGARYRLLETIRQYAREKLMESGGTDAANDRHLGYFLNLSYEAEPGLRGGDYFTWTARLDAERDNLRAATEWGLIARPEAALCMLSNLLFWSRMHNSPLQEIQTLRKLVDQVAAMPLAESDAAPRRAVIRAKGLLAISTMLLPIARPDQLPQIRMDMNEVVEVLRLHDEPFVLAQSLCELAAVQLFCGEDALTVRTLAGESIARFQTMGEDRWTFAPRTLLILLFRIQNDHDAMLAQYQELKRLVGRFDHIMMLPAYQELGYVARLEGDLPAVRHYFEQGVRLARRTGNKTYEAILRSELAHVAREAGNLTEASMTYQETIILWKELGNQGALAHQLECLGFIAYAEGLFEHAARLLGAGEALRETSGSPMDEAERAEYERQVRALRHTLDTDSFDYHWLVGRSMNIDEAIALAVQTSISPVSMPAARHSAAFLVESLTGREHEVLALIAEGLSNSEIAERLFLAPTTVKVHTRHIYEKLGVNSRTQAVAQAHKLKLL